MKHVTSAIALIALAACQTEEGLVTEQPTETLAAEQAAPAGSLFLDIDGALEPGNVLTFVVDGADPGATVYVGVGPSTTPGASCPPSLGGVCIDITNPVGVTSAKANAAGIAYARVTVPAVPTGTFYFQAVTFGANASTSNVVARYRLAAAGGQFLPFTFHFWDVAANFTTVNSAVTAVGAFADATNYASEPFACYTEAPEVLSAPVTTVPCPSCEYKFQVDVAPAFQEFELQGECGSYVGVTSTYFDSIFPGTATAGGGWGGIAGNTDWGIDTAYYNATTQTTGPLALFYYGGYGWYPLGGASVTPSATGTQIVFGVAYNGPFYY